MIDALCCPADGGDLVETDGASPGLMCTNCARSYPVTRGVARFVATDDYVANFSLEWRRHRTTQLDEHERGVSEETFTSKTGWSADEVWGKRVLDVGCGMGRFAEVVTRWGGAVYGVDLSYGVDSAAENLKGQPAFQAVQASVFELPFKPESFDFVYSIGVLDHTPDCERAFKCLPPLLKPGGEIAVWIYSAHLYRPDGVEEKRDAAYRRLTANMSPKTLYALCRTLCRVRLKHRGVWHMLLPGGVFHAIPRLHWEYGEYDLRVLDTFDWYSPRYQSKHTYPEVCRWFREAGLEHVEPLDAEISVRGRKPAGPR
jgi:SAM-dependent methyltransferase